MRAADVLSPAGGIIRAPRRPAGFVPPGPEPRPRGDLASLWPGPREDLCWLSGSWRLLQRTDGHRFSLDDLVTAALAARTAGEPGEATDGAVSAPARILDLGCGIGSVLLMLAWRFPNATLEGIEAQPVSAALARRSIAWNGVPARCRVRDGDFRDAQALDGEAPFHLITGTPPYFARGAGVESLEIQRAPCRFEHRGGVEAYVAAAARHLASDGWFVVCCASAQVEALIAAGAAAGLAVARRRAVIPRAGKPPLFHVFALRPAAARTNAGGDPTWVEPPLTIRDRAGRRTDEFRQLRAEMGMPP